MDTCLFVLPKKVTELFDAEQKCRSAHLLCAVRGGSEHAQELELKFAQNATDSNNESENQLLIDFCTPVPFLKTADFHFTPSQHHERRRNVAAAISHETVRLQTSNGRHPVTMTQEKPGLLLTAAGPEDLKVVIQSFLRDGNKFAGHVDLEESQSGFSASTFGRSWAAIVPSAFNSQP
jgi:hypothetical protein